MSKHTHTSVSQSVRNVLKEAQGKTEEQLEELFGVEFREGKVYDPVYNQSFDNLSLWARFSAEQDQMEDNEYADVYDEGDY